MVVGQPCQISDKKQVNWHVWKFKNIIVIKPFQIVISNGMMMEKQLIYILLERIFCVR